MAILSGQLWSRLRINLTCVVMDGTILEAISGLAELDGLVEINPKSLLTYMKYTNCAV